MESKGPRGFLTVAHMGLPRSPHLKFVKPLDPLDLSMSIVSSTEGYPTAMKKFKKKTGLLTWQPLGPLLKVKPLVNYM